jgi:hypothetical protein
MHILIHEYPTGERAAFDLNDDGTKLVRVLEGQLQEGERFSAWIRAACEGNQQGYDRLLEAIDWLTKETRKRRDAQVRASA